jgi:hypothetical protein
MTDKNGPGQRSKAAAEAKTAEVAREDAANAKANEASGDTPDVEAQAGGDQTPERTDGAPERRDVDAAVDPYPDYDGEDVDALQSHADSRGVEINRDVEKAELIAALRRNDRGSGSPGPDADQPGNVYASYDQMPLEELRSLAASRDVELPEEFRKAHLVTELRAADSGAGVSLSGPAPVEEK